MNKDYKKAEAQLTKEMDKQIRIIYPACAIVLWQQYGWRETRIMRRFITSNEVWGECAGYGEEKSMLQMLEDETGIDLRLTGCPDWHQLQYLDGRAWDGTPITLPQAIYMRQQQKKWLPLLLLACMCLTLYRDEHWGAVRIGRFVGHVDQLRQEVGESQDRFSEMLKEVTGFETGEMWGECKHEQSKRKSRLWQS